MAFIQIQFGKNFRVYSSLPPPKTNPKKSISMKKKNIPIKPVEEQPLTSDIKHPDPQLVHYDESVKLNISFWPKKKS
jgi:hypothetical protein